MNNEYNDLDVVRIDNVSLLYDYIPATDIDECKDAPCSSNAQCINTVGSYLCECVEGFFKEGTKCGTLSVLIVFLLECIHLSIVTS